MQLLRLFRTGHAEVEYECLARDLKIPGQHVEGQIGHGGRRLLPKELIEQPKEGGWNPPHWNVFLGLQIS